MIYVLFRSWNWNCVALSYSYVQIFEQLERKVHFLYNYSNLIIYYIYIYIYIFFFFFEKKYFPLYICLLTPISLRLEFSGIGSTIKSSISTFLSRTIRRKRNHGFFARYIFSLSLSLSERKKIKKPSVGEQILIIIRLIWQIR